MTTATATQTAAATDTNPCADCGALVAIPCYRPAWVYHGLCADCATNAAAATTTALATATTREAPQPRRKQSLPICRGRNATGRKCSNDAAPGSWLCHSCRQS